MLEILVIYLVGWWPIIILGIICIIGMMLAAREQK